MANKNTSYIDTHYVKDSQFRTSYAAGVFGGITPNGLIDINFFSERGPIPKRITFEVDTDTGQVGNEFDRDTKVGVVREVHCGVLMDAELARRVVQWLEEKINQVEGSLVEEND